VTRLEGNTRQPRKRGPARTGTEGGALQVRGAARRTCLANTNYGGTDIARVSIRIAARPG
jgi:hypothetical protein